MNTAVATMSTDAQTAQGVNEGAVRVPWLKTFVILAAMLTAFTGYRVYQHMTAFTVGLDYFAPEFQTYWMNLLYAQLFALTVLGGSILAYLLKTRDRNLDAIAPAEELRRYLVLLAQVLVLTITFYIMTSIYTESDAAWHQVTVRDTDFTPTHIGLFYMGVPMIIITSLTAFVYARTRIPQFANRLSVPFAIAVAGPIMIMPNLGLNEWGHTFFYAEELFAAPIHWGFVLLGWSAFAFGGVLVQSLGRMIELIRQQAD